MTIGTNGAQPLNLESEGETGLVVQKNGVSAATAALYTTSVPTPETLTTINNNIYFGNVYSSNITATNRRKYPYLGLNVGVDYSAVNGTNSSPTFIYNNQGAFFKMYETSSGSTGTDYITRFDMGAYFGTTPNVHFFVDGEGGLTNFGRGSNYFSLNTFGIDVYTQSSGNFNIREGKDIVMYPNISVNSFDPGDLVFRTGTTEKARIHAGTTSTRELILSTDQISFDGGVYYNTRILTTGGAITINDGDTFVVKSGAGSATITLPSASAHTGRTITLANKDSISMTVAGTLVGSISLLNTGFSGTRVSVVLQSDGVSWIPVGGYVVP